MKEGILLEEQSERKIVEFSRLKLVTSEINKDNRFLAASPNMLAILEKAKIIASLGISVMIVGETGVGKEELAKYLHAQSGLQGEFIQVNSAGIPETLSDSILFGHIKGSFTGAVCDQKGYFENAQGGTLFLDEISTMSQDVQAKILQATNRDGRFTPVGSNKTLKTSCRLISASNYPVEKLISEGKLREDLFYRLSGDVIEIPPLRERLEDIILLSHYFLDEACRKSPGGNLVFSEEAIHFLCHYKWPGNIRELENAVERAVAIANNPIIKPEDFSLRSKKITECQEHSMNFSEKIKIEEKRLLEEALKQAGWNSKLAMKILGINKRGLRYYMEKYNLSFPYLDSSLSFPPEMKDSPALTRKSKTKTRKKATSSKIEFKSNYPKEVIIKALEENNWNQTEAAKSIEIDKSWINYLIKKYGILPPAGFWKSGPNKRRKL